ncbi:phage Gp19/Gp15/Gp42 family protein [Faecalibaculum rodentium]|uniref:phage Gp19/Gp15/Gp42 family protein n=1 Tax=Faecalibaculum rodentium TaxID=1702221 RepID=UPI0026222AC7|nr:phage Gp19/Gp15/Gp42 family protein [Faecalibaculum rodentium]
MDTASYASVSDVESLFRPLDANEQDKANALIPVVEDSLRQEAMNRGKDLDKLVDSGRILPGVLRSVIVDVVARALMTSTTQEPMTQFSESTLGYAQSGTFLVPGGGLFIKKSELARLGLTKQRIQLLDLYGLESRND